MRMFECDKCETVMAPDMVDQVAFMQLARKELWDHAPDGLRDIDPPYQFHLCADCHKAFLTWLSA